MEIYFQLVTDADALKKACEELARVAYLGFDVETTELDPYKGELRLVQLSDGKKTVVIDLRVFGSGKWKAESGRLPEYVKSLRANPDLAPLRALLSSTK